eukprot:gb/GFBE01043987.1/.p1 GENE.gb/GFBE01043987.1/~~gb/GFBE01043987.1/.p1  ORF type:complete len:327 (+),score=84.31 gb/GFBE01043987.1/:1-981(+)
MAMRRTLVAAALFGAASIQLKDDGTPLTNTVSGSFHLNEHVPDIDTFASRAEAMPKDPGADFGEQYKDVKMLIGVMSTALEKKYRDVHRRTWMSSEAVKVCKVAGDSKQLGGDCNVFATFVLGTDGKGDEWTKAEAEKHKDITFATTLDGTVIPDDLTLAHRSLHLKKKSLGWFRHAVDTFSDVTHVLKIDIDTYPYPGQIARVFVAARGKNSDEELSPMLFEKHEAPPTGWQESVGGVHLGSQGQLYGYSANTLRCMFKSLKENYKTDPVLNISQQVAGEDGFMVELTNRLTDGGKGHCKPTWNLHAGFGELVAPKLRLWEDILN